MISNSLYVPGHLKERLANAPRRKFEHLGRECEEIIVHEWRNGFSLVLWCFHPFDKLYVGGTYESENPCVYQYFNPEEEGNLTNAREMVRVEFEQHHKLKPLAEKG